MSRKTTRAQDSVRDQLLRIETLIQSSARARSPSTANPQQMLPIQSDHTFPQELPSVDNNQPDPTEARHDMSLDSVAPSDFTRQTRGSSSVPTTASMLAPSIQSAPLYSPNTGHHSIGTAVPVSPFQGTLIANSDHVESVSHDNEDNEDNEDSQDKVTSRARISEYHGEHSLSTRWEASGNILLTRRHRARFVVVDMLRSRHGLDNRKNRMFRLCCQCAKTCHGMESKLAHGLSLHACKQ